MVVNIDAWLFKWSDLKECEPEIQKDGSLNCDKCKNRNCEYYTEVEND